MNWRNSGVAVALGSVFLVFNLGGCGTTRGYEGLARPANEVAHLRTSKGATMRLLPDPWVDVSGIRGADGKLVPLGLIHGGMIDLVPGRYTIEVTTGVGSATYSRNGSPATLATTTDLGAGHLYEPDLRDAATGLSFFGSSPNRPDSGFFQRSQGNLGGSGTYQVSITDLGPSPSAPPR